MLVGFSITVAKHLSQSTYKEEKNILFHSFEDLNPWLVGPIVLYCGVECMEEQSSSPQGSLVSHSLLQGHLLQRS